MHGMSIMHTSAQQLCTFQIHHNVYNITEHQLVICFFSLPPIPKGNEGNADGDIMPKCFTSIKKKRVRIPKHVESYAKRRDKHPTLGSFTAPAGNKDQNQSVLNMDPQFIQLVTNRAQLSAWKLNKTICPGKSSYEEEWGSFFRCHISSRNI